MAMVTDFMMGKFYIRPDVAARFSEYARAAQPNEIGGFLRVQRSGNNFIATDLKVFPQSGNATFFQMDGRARAKWMMQMKRDGRKEELNEWNCLIHSHPPGCPPFLSGTDLEQIVEFGTRRHFWSVIQTADPENIIALDWRVHFYHGGMAPDAEGNLQPTTPPLLVKDIPVDILHPDWKAIHDEVKGELGFKGNFVGQHEKRTNGYGGTTGGRVVRTGGYQTRNSGVVVPNVADLDRDDVPEIADSGVFSSDDLQALRDAGIDRQAVQAAMDAEFHDEELMTIEEGSIVKVTEQAGQIVWGEDDDGEYAARVRDMVDSEFTVEDVTDEGNVVMNDGVILPPAVLEVVQS